MIDCVVDASIFGPLFFLDEVDRLHGGLAQQLERGGCIAPVHWRLELTNQIIMGVRRKRMLAEEASLAIELIDSLEVIIDGETWKRHEEIYRLATQYGLTAYDAAYLELAVRRQATLATYDSALRKAAQAAAIKVLPE